MKRISFNLTQQQVLARTKTVTRRLGWRDLKPGTILRGVDRLRSKDAKTLAFIEVVDVRTEPVCAITSDDVRREGLSYGDCWCKRKTCAENGTRWCFINAFCDAMKVGPLHRITRIKFRYLDEPLCARRAPDFPNLICNQPDRLHCDESSPDHNILDCLLDHHTFEPPKEKSA